MRGHRPELLADFRETYHVGLYEVSPWEAAELVERLPASSRLAQALEPDMVWPEERYYLACIEFWLHSLLYGMAKKSRRGPKPKPILPKGLEPMAETRRIKGVAMPTSEIDALFHIKQKTE